LLEGDNISVVIVPAIPALYLVRPSWQSH